MNYDEQEVRKAFSILNDGFTEVRMLRDKMTVSGYFSDADTLLKNMKKYANVVGMNFYMVMNKIDDACYSRKGRDCFIEYPKETTADANITERQWFLIDMDCERAKGVSSNQEEFNLAKEKAAAVYKHLSSIGFEKPVVAISGNGYHLLYKICLKSSEKSNALLKDCLLALDEWFSDDRVKIDTTVFNAARITKLYGTMAQKGQSTEERPHRLSRIIDIPKEIKATDAAILLKLAEQKTKQEEPPKQQYYGQQSEFNIDDFIRKHNIQITSESRTQGGRRMILDHCPFNPDHNGKDAALFVKDSGGYGFKCLHASCSQNGWKEFRKYYEPDAYTERTTPRVNSAKPEVEPEPDPYAHEPDFYTSDKIKAKNRDNLVSIKTGIYELDRKLIGLNKGEVSCLSGVNASGKSSVLSQVSLDVINQGYKVALFSGELDESKVLNWLQLQAAGKLYTKPTQYENYYYVPDDVKPLINNWLQDKLYVYNNRKGNEIEKILAKVGECIGKNKVDMVILDNLMAMNLDAMAGDKYEKQSKFSKRIEAFAKQADVHIVLVAHPRKSIGFIRKDDISGTADITNMVDNVFIVHRVNNDFRRLGAQTFGWKLDEELFQYSNVIEVCKNRDLGVQDLFVGLYYEPESKRFLNDKYEMKHFKWEDQIEFKLPIADDNEYRLPFDLN